MPTKYFEVLEDFDPKKHETKVSSSSILQCLGMFKKGDIISPKKFAESNGQFLSKRGSSFSAKLYTVDRSIQIAKKLGIIALVDDKPIS